MKKPISITRKLSISLVLGVVVFWLGATAIAAIVVQHELKEAFDQTLEQAAIRLLPLAIHDLEEEGEGEENEYRISTLEDFDSSFAYYIRNKNGDRIALSDDLQIDMQLKDVRDGFSYIGSLRYFAVTDPKTGIGIVIAEKSNHREKALWESVLALLLPLAGLVPLMIIGVWYAVRVVMKPIGTLKNDIADRDSLNLSPLSNEHYPKELAPISDAIAELLERLRLALEAERSFAAKCAHELRTPLAGALAQVQRLGIELANDKGASRVKEIEKSLRHLSELSEKLLQLSRSEAGFAKSDIDVELNVILDFMVDDYRKHTQIQNRLVQTNSGGFKLRGKIIPDAFAIVMRNLIENAFLHGHQDGEVEIKISSETSFSVLNDADVIPIEIFQHINEPFKRGNTDAAGSGLGLSIISTIVKQCGGELSFFSPQKNKPSGFEVVIEFNGVGDDAG